MIHFGGILTFWWDTVSVYNSPYWSKEISEINTVNDKYENFVTTDKEIAAECLTAKQKPSVEFPLSQKQ